MTQDEQLRSEHSAWEEALKKYTKDYEMAVKYDDYGAREHSEEMIKYSQRRIDELEQKMTRKGA